MLEVFIDGASAGNPGPSGAGIFIKKDGHVTRHSIPLGIMDNHEAEYWALIKALEICGDYRNETLSFRTDSQAIFTAVEKEFAKNKKYSLLLEKALSHTKEMPLFFIKWIPSSQNKAADELARRAIRMNGDMAGCDE